VSTLWERAWHLSEKSHTLIEGSRELQGVDELRVETRCNFDTHTTDEKVEVHDPEVGLLVPWRLVLFDHARDNWIGSMADVRCLEETHDGGVDDDPKVVVTFVKPCGPWDSYTPNTSVPLPRLCTPERTGPGIG
jgi:hypothetical protein